MSNRGRHSQQFQVENNYECCRKWDQRKKNKKVTEEGTASEDHADPYDYFISAGEKFKKGFI